MVARIVLTFSALVGLIGVATAGPYADLDHELQRAGTQAAKTQILRASSLIQNDSKLAALLESTSDDAEEDTDPTSGPPAVAAVVELRALAESEEPHSNVKGLVAQIKRSPVYADPGEKESTNWLGRALDTLRKWRFHMPKSEAPNMSPGIFGDWIIYVAWFILGGAVLLFVLYGLKKIDFKKLAQRKLNSGVLEDDEPVRTLDEWLVLADQLEREGKYREAVRSLYLACLLKIDEARIARFDRGQTNWEHLARIESSPRRPLNLDFRKPTQAFDRIWYGYQVNGSADVDRFRAWYGEIVDATRQVAA